MIDAPPDPWNRLRLDRSSSAGHVESYFVKANDPSGERAVWVRFTLLAPRGRPEATVVEVWAIVFDRARSPEGYGEGFPLPGPGRPLAVRERFPIDGASIERSRPRIEAGGSHFEPGWTRGRVERRAGGGGAATGNGDGASGGGHGTGAGLSIAWDLRWPRHAGAGGALALYPSRLLYEAPFPSTKVVSPVPDTTLVGSVRVRAGEGPERTFEVVGWPGMQGHNWGRRHALRYAWAHANCFDGAPGAVFEAASASVAVGPLATPLLTVALLRLPGGREIDLRGPLRWWNPSAEVVAGPGGIRYRFAAESDEVRLTASLEAEPEETALLAYEDPEGGGAFSREGREGAPPSGAIAWCRNAKTARVTLDVAARPGPGRPLGPIARLTGTGALEVLTREKDPGRAPDA